MSHRRKHKDLKKLTKPAARFSEDRPNLLSKPPERERKRIEEIKKAFGTFDHESLICALAGLQVVPELQSHTIRLEVATRVASLIGANGKDEVDSVELQSLLNRYLPVDSYFGMYEDPLEDLFTTNIEFIGGNYMVFQGALTGETYVLRNVLNALYHCTDQLPRGFYSIIYPVIISALGLSNEVALRLGYERYQTGPCNNRQDFVLPDNDEFHRLQSAVLFSKEEINGILSLHNLKWESLTPLITRVGDQRLNDDDLTANPLILKPFVETEEGSIILACPGSVLISLRHFILSFSKARGVMDILLKAYSDSIWANSLKHLSWMAFEPLFELEQLPIKGGHSEIKEAFFEIDTDKIAYVQLIPDLGEGFDYAQPDTIWNPEALYQEAVLRENEITQWVIKKYGKEKKVFTLRILGYIGRGVIFGLEDRPMSNVELVLFPESIEMISQIAEERDSLALWKFAKSYETASRRSVIVHTSFLDLYSFYLDHGHSFYASDDALFNMISIVTGYSRHLRETVSKEWDVHGASRWRPAVYESVSRFSIKGECPLYSPTARFRETAEFFIEGYSQPIWVEALESSYEHEDLRLISDMAETIAYWLWQISPALKVLLEPLGPEPISIRFVLEDIDSWRQMNPKIPVYELVSLRYLADEDGITYWVPVNIRTLAQSTDNLGEQYLVDGLLKGFGALLIRKGLQDSLGDETRVRIIEKHAPLGLMKKMLAVNTGKDVALDPTDVPPERLVQEYDENIQRDELAQKLFGSDFRSEDIHDSKKINQICNLAVDHYLSKIRSYLKNLSWRSTLAKLMGNNEAILYQRVFWHFVTPAGIECFSSLSEAVERDVKNDPRRDLTSLANRTLIEIVVAEPPRGKEELSVEKLDELIGASCQLIDWGMLSERVNLKLTDHELRILKTGRIRVESGELDSIWAPFYRTKTLEGIERSISEFDREYETVEETVEETKERLEWDEAFEDEFGLTMIEIIDFHLALIAIGREKKEKVPHLNFVSFIKELEDNLKWTQNKIELAIALFSLASRKSYDEPPELFKRTDVWPWRYNRRLSYLRRPIMIGPEPENNPLILWGTKQVDESIRHLLHLVRNGRYQNEAKSEKMKNLIGNTNNTLSHDFVINVKAWLEQQSGWRAESEIPIGPGARLESDDDLGDIDILAVDLKNRIIYSIECKKINPGRNAREIAQEIDKFVGEDEDKWSEKHLRRDKWLRENIKKVQKEYELPEDDFQLQSIIMTSVEIPSSHFRKMPLKIISFTKLQRSGVAILSNMS